MLPSVVRVTLKLCKAIEHAKWERWDEMFEIFDVYPGETPCHTLELFVASFLVIVLAGGCQNMRPEFRKYAARFPDASSVHIGANIKIKGYLIPQILQG